MRVLELFAGCGGAALAWHRAGAEHVGFVERDPFARRVLARHWPGVPQHDDVTIFDASAYRGRVDVLSGGPPCQPVSHAGARRGQADERWLWGAFIAAAVACEAPVVVAENPPALLSANEGDAFYAVLCALGDAGYVVEWDCLAAGTVGAPHRRDRVWVVASRVGPVLPASDSQPSMFAGRPAAWPRAGRWKRHRLTASAERWPAPSPLPWETASGVGALPTPIATDGTKAPTNSLARTVETGARKGRANRPLSDGRLSPDLAEWMMGMPLGWTRPDGASLLDAAPAPWLPDLTPTIGLTTEREHRRDRLRCAGNSVCVPAAETIARLVTARAASRPAADG